MFYTKILTNAGQYETALSKDEFMEIHDTAKKEWKSFFTFKGLTKNEIKDDEWVEKRVMEIDENITFSDKVVILAISEQKDICEVDKKKEYDFLKERVDNDLARMKYLNKMLSSKEYQSVEKVVNKWKAELKEMSKKFTAEMREKLAKDNQEKK